jgi:hypothetical protein
MPGTSPRQLALQRRSLPCLECGGDKKSLQCCELKSEPRAHVEGIVSPLRSRKARPLRYYLYISDSKLEMLFEQINPGVLKRISAEVKVDLKLASLTLRGAENPGPTRTAKLQIVERYIDAHHNLGTLREPGSEYFRGQMDMQWGPLVGQLDAVLFRGYDAEGLNCVLLGGSVRHLIGQHPQRDVYPFSLLPEIMELVRGTEEVQGMRGVNSERWPSMVLGMTNIFDNRPAQRLDFLAIPLIEGEAERDYIPRGVPLTMDKLARLRRDHQNDPPVHVVIGTPLYVAMARETQTPGEDSSPQP